MPVFAGPTRSSSLSVAGCRPSGATRSQSTWPRSKSSTPGSSRSTASWHRSPALIPGPSCWDDPGSRTADQPHLRFGDRRRPALSVGFEARRLCGVGAADQPVGRALGDRLTLKGRLEDSALGGGRGRQPGPAANQPLSRPLSPVGSAPRQEPGEVLGRTKALDHFLAHALAQPGLLTTHCR
jgi:hypothetical protein